MILTSLEPTSAATANGLRLVLITNGLRPISERFTTLQGLPVGIISWDSKRSGGLVESIARIKPLADLYARLRQRRYASLSHLCRENELRYVSIEKSQVQVLREVLAAWKPELVITSGCPLVPVYTLSGVHHGGINLHPSLLPAYRGADPITWQVIDQVPYLGVSVHRLSERYDAGSILGQTKVRRPQGVNRVELARTLEGDIGFELLNQVLGNLVRSENIPECVQPESSPTRRATKMSLHLVGYTWELDDLGVYQVWDMLKYYDQCPNQWLGLQGWRRFLSWRPISFQYVTNHDFLVTSSEWRVKRQGLTIYLVNQLAIITLRAVIRVNNR